MKIKVYSTPTCPFCKMVKEFFRKNKIDFEDVDVSKDEKLVKELVKKSGQKSVPVIEIKKAHRIIIISGFDERALKMELGIKD